MTTQVKICGIRSFESADAAVNAGADLLGFNFVPSSQRYIDPELAKSIIASIEGKAKTVGVFRNAEVTYINKLIAYLQLDFVQLHGDETPEEVKQVIAKTIKAVGIAETDTQTQSVELIQSYTSDYVLIDRLKQGEGSMIHTTHAKQLAQLFPLFLAGGLTPENVAEKIKAVQPFGVDVASGIEANGQEDIEKITLFIQNAKGVTI